MIIHTKRKLINDPIYSIIQKNKTSKNKFNQRGKQLYTKNYKTL